MLCLIYVELRRIRGATHCRPRHGRGRSTQLPPSDNLAILQLHRRAHPAINASADVKAGRDRGDEIAAAQSQLLCRCKRCGDSRIPEMRASGKESSASST